ncbi:MAG: HPr kinase/phosphorylase, partial [Clostridia bacterium]|nr:HPr kinase/phosphorylase [Clostridia bacterium]
MENFTVKVSVAEFASALKLQTVTEGNGEIVLSSRNISRPGLQLAGYFEHFDHTRIQVIGMAEHEYIETLSVAERKRICRELFSRNIPCLIVARNLDIHAEIKNAAAEYGCPLFVSGQITTQVVNDIYFYLNRVLTEETMRHGVLMDVSGVGILIEGSAGIGKSEIALELINRGHRLVADDCVII